MSADDHAILVGISHYPELGDGGTSANLAGPENDVEAIAAWLESNDRRCGTEGEHPHHQDVYYPPPLATAAANAHPRPTSWSRS